MIIFIFSILFITEYYTLKLTLNNKNTNRYTLIINSLYLIL